MVLRGYKWSWFLLLILLGLKADGFAPHPLYVSITEMNYNEKTHNIEVSCKVFTDDLEKALEKKTGKSYHIAVTTDTATASAIADYLNEHLAINFDNKAVNLKFLGYELEKEAVWSYLEGSVSAVPKTALVRNSIFYESFDQQINLIHITVHGERKSTKLVNPEAKATLDF